MQDQYEPLRFCLNFLSLPLLLTPCVRCITLQPVRKYDQKIKVPKCRTQHSLLNIFGFRAPSMSRRLGSHNSKVCQTHYSRFAESYDKDDRTPGIDPCGWAPPLRQHVSPPCVILVHNTFSNLQGWCFRSCRRPQTPRRHGCSS